IERVINVPSRGIGDTTMKALNDQSAAQNVTLWTVIEGDLSFLPPRASKAVKEFREIVHDLQRAVNNPLPELYDYLLLRTGYRRMLTESRDVQDESRLQNIDEMMNSAREYSEQNPGATLGDYLDSLTLMSDLDKYESQKGVTLMTLHAAKGLEFKVVFLTGMEEGILPHSQSKDSNEDLEEERRLCYVGMTRAREQLWCVHCLERRLHGQFREQSPSPFITEIPENVREEVRMARARYVPDAPSWRERPMKQSDRYSDRYSGEPRRAQPSSYSRPASPPPRVASPAPAPPAPRKNDSVNGVLSFFKESPVQLDPAALRPATPPSAPAALKRGQRVRHDQFGDGTILTMEGSGPEAKLTVYFDRGIGSKKFIAKYAKLTRL
ncbi:MAG: ATP-dependent helicase UvrD/PcrA, partial [Thermoanaerobaculia bacterium]|nr:ATP-dependent helicase UvrD/PcrA [Thermoanaerobaculia bacterium]